MISLPKSKEMRIRTVIGGKESGYVSSTTNHQPAKPHLMAIENVSQGLNPVMHSDLESAGGTNFVKKNHVLRMNPTTADQSYIPGGRSISVRNEHLMNHQHSSQQDTTTKVIVQ